MKLLRKTIRKLLLESNQLQWDLYDLLFPDDRTGDDEFPEIASGLSVFHREAAKEEATWDSDEDIDRNFEIRRSVKRFWAENADHDFWNNRVLVMHSLSYYGNLHSAEKEFHTDRDLALSSFFKKYPKGIRQKDEMSAYGVSATSGQPIKDFMRKNGIHMGVLLEGYVTWASGTDSYTESRSNASVEDLIRHAQSGMPKRPEVLQNFPHNQVLFDESDLKANDGEIGEVIIDNWTYDTVVILKEETTTSQRKIFRKLCKKHGVKLLVK